MAVDSLRVQVLFAALDRLTGPLKSMGAGSQGLKAHVAATRKEIVALERAQGKLGGFKRAEAEYAQLGNAVQAARLEHAAYKRELQGVDKVTAAQARKLEKLAAAEAKTGAAYQQSGAKLQRLGSELEATGADVAALGRHEDMLASKLYDANKRLDEQTAALSRNAAAQARADKVKAIGQKMSGAGMGLSLGVTLPAVAFAKVASGAAIESAGAIAQVQAALDSMGPKAQRTLGQLQAHASKLQAMSLFDDDDILKSVTANLLTFGKVQGPIFDKAQQAAVDLSARLGQDLQSSTMQLGKALNDPAKGVTALQRVGVSFTAEQKKQIAALQKSGQVAKAQTIILGELEKQFGGAAKAARDADPNAATAENWRNFQENVGAVVNVLLPKLNLLLSGALRWFNGLSEGQQRAVLTAVALAAALGPVLIVVGRLVTGFGMVMPLLSRLGPLFLLVGKSAMRAGLMMMANPIVLIIVAIVAALGAAAYLIWKHWDTIKAAFGAAGSWIMAKLGELKALFMRFPMVFGPLGLAVALVMNNWARIKGAFNTGVAFLGSLPSRMLAMGKAIIGGLLRGLSPSALADRLLSIARLGITKFKNFFGIKSPSRLFWQMGGHMTEGLGRGIGAGESAAVRRVDSLSRRVAGAFAAGSLVATPALASVKPLPASAVAPRATGSSAPGTGLTIGHVTIQLTQQPGEDAGELARRLMDELARLKANDARSDYHDDD